MQATNEALCEGQMPAYLLLGNVLVKHMLPVKL